MSAFRGFCCKSHRHLVRLAKVSNIRIPMAGFLNQNSLLELDCEKLFFAQRPKIVLQHNPCIADIEQGASFETAVANDPGCVKTRRLI
jgi:hypothetical protein